MQVQRCPECGGRLKTSYCDICLRRVPFKGAPAKQTFQHTAGSSAHREEKHACVDFDYEKRPKKVHASRTRKQPGKSKFKLTSAIAIAVALMSVFSGFFGLVEEAIDSVSPEPEINIYDGFVEAGQLGAEDVPEVISGELYNANGIRITADSAGLSYGEYAIFMTIFNETEQDVEVSADLVSVNGYMVPCGMYQDIDAGDCVQTYMTFYEDELEKAYITEVAQVEFVLNVYDADSYEDIVAGELLTVDTQSAEHYEQPTGAYGAQLYNDGSTCILLRDMQMDGYGDGQLEVHMENLSESTVSVYLEGVWVNGEETNAYFWNTLRPDTRAVDSIYLYEMDKMDITEWEQVEEITLELYVEYMDGWDILETASEAITFNPNEIR